MPFATRYGTWILAVKGLQDRAIAPALAKALGAPDRVLQETVRVDGSRVIRFSGNRCLHIPTNALSWRESQVAPTEWVVSNWEG